MHAQVLQPLPASRAIQVSTSAVSVVLDALLPIERVCAVTSLKRATIYREMAAGRFPRSIPIAGRRVAWSAADIARWISSKREAAAA